MKCLVIADNVGTSAPGIVNETIIRELSKDIEISLCSIQNRDDLNLNIKNLPSIPMGYRHWRVEKILFSLFRRNLLDDYWLYRQKKLVDYQFIDKQDVILSLISNHNYKSLLLGNYLAKKFNKKWIVYSVDAIPAPMGWEKNTFFYRNTKKFINKYLFRCDAFFSANKQMLNYQLSLLNKPRMISGVLYNPIRTDLNVDVSLTNEKSIFLYTGGIYGPRKIESLLDGFRLYLKEYPIAQLIFVGTKFSQLNDEYNDLINSGNIKVYGFTQNLLPFYNKASALIDVNAYFENDVFLSSKIVNYLPIKRPIISITGLNSPSRNIFIDDSSIIHCQHQAHEIYEALKTAVKMQSVDWTNRNKYVELFTAENVVKDLVDVLDRIVSK